MRDQEVLNGAILMAAFHLSIQGLKSFLKLAKNQDKAKWVQKQAIQDPNEKEMLQKGLGNRILILKLHCTKSKMHKLQSDVGALENFYNQFPLSQNIQNILKSTEYMQYDAQKWMSKQFSKPLKMGTAIQPNIFRIKHEYKGEDYSTVKWIYIGLVSVVVGATDICLKSFTFQHDHLFFNGPVIGKLLTTFQLITDSPIIVQCQINGKQITPKLMGLRKEDIVEFYRHEAFKGRVSLTIILSLLLIFKKPIFKAMKFFIDKWRKNFDLFFGPLKFKKKVKTLDVEVGDDLNCIICMVKCRNIVFPKCRHLSICEGCYQGHQEEMSLCPLCRNQVGDELVYIQDIEEMPVRGQA